MDTIIHVKYKHIQAEDTYFSELSPNKSCTQNFRFRFLRQAYAEQGFQIIKLHIYEVDPPEQETVLQLWRRQLKYLARPLFRTWFARSLAKEQERLAQQIQEELLPLLDQWGDNGCIYDEALPDSSGWIREILPFPEFRAYTERKWISRLISYVKDVENIKSIENAKSPKSPKRIKDVFLILGSGDGLQPVIEEFAPRTKSILWIVPDFTYQNQAENLVEYIYQEYGLAIDLRFLPEGGTFARLRISAEYLTEPLNILDFTGEKYLPSLQLAPGSVWLDFGAMEEKEKRILGRRMPVQYVSLKTI